MENKKVKCLFEEHKENDAVSYCHECKIYMCNKCAKYHQELFKNHHHYYLDKENKDIFIDICKEENHSMKLEYFRKTHNILCCEACIAKMEYNNNGKNKNCKIHTIEDIKDEKKNILKENIKFLENLSNNIEKSIK